MRFSPMFLSKAILEPLKYFFSNYTGSANLVFNTDPLVSTIEIGTMNDFNKEKIQAKPRILLDRGPIQYTPSGLTDSMMDGSNPYDTKGLDNRRNLVFIQGQASLLIEARNEGTCELITDMVSHFLVWSKPHLCNSLGFKSFANPINITECSLNKEDTEIFQCTVSIPWSTEEVWQVNEDALKLKGMAIQLAASL